MGGTEAIQTQRCLMKRDEHDEDDIADSERAESQREGASFVKEKTVQAVGAQPWNGGRPGSAAPGTAPRPFAAMPRSLSEATTIVPNRRCV